MQLIIYFLMLVLVALFVFSLYYWFLTILQFTKEMFFYFLEKSKRNIHTRNNLLSFIYFLIEMGPNVSSFSIVAIFITGKETALQLILIFFCGILMKQIGREMKRQYYEKVLKTNTNKKSSIDALREKLNKKS